MKVVKHIDEADLPLIRSTLEYEFAGRIHKSPRRAFIPNDVVKIKFGEERSGIVLSGPDDEGDYEVGYFTAQGVAVTGYYRDSHLELRE